MLPNRGNSFTSAVLLLNQLLHGRGPVNVHVLLQCYRLGQFTLVVEDFTMMLVCHIYPVATLYINFFTILDITIMCLWNNLVSLWNSCCRYRLQYYSNTVWIISGNLHGTAWFVICSVSCLKCSKKSPTSVCNLKIFSGASPRPPVGEITPLAPSYSKGALFHGDNYLYRRHPQITIYETPLVSLSLRSWALIGKFSKL